MNIKKHIPNLITSLNLLSGSISCVFAFYGAYKIAAYFLILAAIFDFLDGFVARLLKSYSEIGKELDSLADMVSFGLAPGIMIYSYLSALNIYFAFIGFLIPIFSAYRLAKFNIDTRQTSSFIGLPTPANAIFWIFLISDILPTDMLLWMNPQAKFFTMLITALAICLFCFLMISEIPMFALKFKTFDFKTNKIKYIFLIISILLLIILQFKALPILIGLYILMSVASNLLSVKDKKI